MKNKILFVSSLASKKWVESVYQQTNSDPGFAIQKFNRLVVKGLLHNDAKVTVLSAPPQQQTNKIAMSSVREKEEGIVYNYVPYISIPLFKSLCLFFYTFFYVFVWGLSDRKKKCVICDVLTISVCMGALLGAKFSRTTVVGMITDMFGLVARKRQTLKIKIATLLNNIYINAFDKYILLTEQMNEVVNQYNRPYMIMEALCDTIFEKEISIKAKNHPRTVLYAGGIHEKYGLKMLAEGFLKANVPDAVLVYYGSGPYVNEYKELCKKYSSLQYRGVAPNETIIAEEQKASLLVNPRFTMEAFTKYSFPSKNMEFMASGTPLLTTRLPGMPADYYPYVFLFEEETVEGYAKGIREALSYSDKELIEFGKLSKLFVLSNKNCNVQADRILNFL